MTSSFLDNELVKFVDSILPYFQLPLVVVKDAIVLFEQDKSVARRHGDTLQFCGESADYCLRYFPEHREVIQPLLQRLSVDYHNGEEPLVNILDVLIILTITCRGRMKEKSELLYSFFAVSAPEGMLESEHATLIHRVGLCLKKIGALKSTELTEDDAAYLAFKARIRNDGGRSGFHPSLLFTEFYQWVQNSTETNVTFKFVRLINRMLEICLSLDARVDALSSMLSTITSTPDRSFGVLKLDHQSTELCKTIPHILYLGDKSVSFLVPATDIYCSDVFAQIDTVYSAPYPLYELTKRLKNQRMDNDPKECCEKTYRARSRKQVHWGGRNGTQNGSGSAVPSLRLDISSNMQPDSQYVITIYTATMRFPPVTFRTLQGHVSDSPKESKVSFHPATMSVTQLDSMLHGRQPLSVGSLTSVFTGCLCPADTVLNQICKTFASVAMEGSIFSPQRLAGVLGSMVETHYRCSWRECEEKFTSITGLGDVAIDGMMCERTGLNQIFACSCDWTIPEWKKKLNDTLSSTYFEEFNKTVASIYMDYAAPFRPPVHKFDRGRARVFLALPGVCPSPQIGVAIAEEVRDMSARDNILGDNGPNHILIVVSSLHDLMKPVSLWDEDDSTPHIQSQESIESDKPEVKLRGKHELIHGAYTAATSTPVVDTTYRYPNLDSEVQRGGDRVFNGIVRALHGWMKLASVGSRRITIISCNWSHGADFSLCLDGDLERCISHVSLEPTEEVSTSECYETIVLFDRIKASFNQKTTIEYALPCSTPRSAVLDSTHGRNPSPLSFVPFSRAADMCMTRSPLLLRGADVTDGPKITDISDTHVCVEVSAKGHGYIVCNLYEVPCMVTYDDVSRLVSQELNSMTLLDVEYGRCVERSRIKCSFKNLTPFCAYCIVIKTSLTPPAPGNCGVHEEVTHGSSIPPMFVHFRTFDKATSCVSTSLVSAMSEVDCMYASEIVHRMKDQLDGSRRPLAAAVHIIQSNTLKNVKLSSLENELPAFLAKNYSEEMKVLCRMSSVVHCGLGEESRSTNRINKGYLEMEDESIGGISVSSNGRFCRLSLLQNSTNSLLKLSEALNTIANFPDIENIQIFSSKPLVRYTENTVEGCTIWDRSKHYTNRKYGSVLTEVFDKLLLWKSGGVGRDCQLYTVVNVAEILVCYIHRASTPAKSGFRHFIFPIYTGINAADETIMVPLGHCKLNSNFHFTTYTCDGNNPKTDLPYGTPFQVVKPFFHLHGNGGKNGVKNHIIYKVVSVAGPQEDTLDDRAKIVDYYGYHNHIVVKMIAHDIDNIEIVVGPIVGKVTSSTCSILFEINRRVANLKCVLRSVESPENSIELLKNFTPYIPVRFDFEGLQNGEVYEIFLPEINGSVALGKFRTLSATSLYSEVVFIGEEHLELFPVAKNLIADISTQQMVSFAHIQTEAMVKSYVSKVSSVRNPVAFTGGNDPSYRRPWLALSSRMKGLACTSSAVFHIGSHALLSRIIRQLAGPLVQIVKRYNLDNEEEAKTSALARLYQMQLIQTIEDSLRLIWIIEPAIKDVFQSASNIPLYNAEYWLSEKDIWDTIDEHVCSNRDFIALGLIRKLYQKNLLSYIYSLRNWNKRSYNHFFRWDEGSVCVACLDQTSQQLEYESSTKMRTVTNLTGGSETVSEVGKDEIEDADDEEPDEKNESEKSGIKALTFSAAFMSENQWKQVRQILVDKTVNQLVICSQYPVVPLELVDPDMSSTRPLWNPPTEDTLKFLQQLFKWLVPKKNQYSGKTATLVCTSDVSYVTNIQDIRSGMKIQQVCLGKFSCVSEAFSGLPPLTLDSFRLKGRIEGIKYSHRLHGLDTVRLDSSRTGVGGKHSGEMDIWQEPSNGVYGVMRFWFDTWMATGTWDFKKIPSSGPREICSGKDAVLLVGPVLGAPYVTDTKDGSRMMVPVLFEVDRDVSITMIATDLFSGKQLARTMNFVRYKPIVVRIGPLKLDSRYTIDINEGVQNTQAYSFVIQTTINWDETNIAILNAETHGAEDPARNSSDYIHDLINRFRVPFHGLTCVLHINVDVDVGAILDEVRTMPGLNELIQKAKTPNVEIAALLQKFVNEVMDRIRQEYRLFFSKPSYRELLMRGFNVFMSREDVFEEPGDDDGSLTSLLNLIVSRVRQEYFDQFVCQDDRIYSAWPRVKKTKEMMQNQAEQHQADLEDRDPDAYIGDMLILTPDNINDSDILKIPRIRKPDRIYFDPKVSAAETILQQWMRNLVPPPPLWIPWESPNKKVTIENFCTDDDENIREIYEKVVNSNVTYGSRIIVLPKIGNLFSPQSRVGYKLQEWMNIWISGDPSRAINLVCPSFNQEGTILCTVEYTVVYGQLVIQMVNSIFCSNEKKLAKAKREKLAAIKKKTQKMGNSRKALAKKKDEETRLKAEMQIELQAMCTELTPDGYIIYECKTRTGTTSSGDTVTVVYTEMKNMGSRIDGAVDEYGNELNPKPSLFDYLSLPLWFTKFCPGTPGVFVQDEINLIIRQDPSYRHILQMIEQDENIFNGMCEAYQKSRLSELSRPPDLRDVDMDVPGMVEMWLERTIETIWKNILPAELRGRLLTLTDDFIRSFCLSRAFPNVESSLSSPVTFAKSMRIMILSSAQLFLACKLAMSPDVNKYQHIHDMPEFPEDDDVAYVSEDEGSENEYDMGSIEPMDDEVGAEGDIYKAPPAATEQTTENEAEYGTAEAATEAQNEEELPTAEGEDGKEEYAGDGLGEDRDEVPPEMGQDNSNELEVPLEVGPEEAGPSEKELLVAQLHEELYNISYKKIWKRRAVGEAVMYMSPALHM